ncbi:Na(+)-translocating NADH-quinone reductase subunit A [Devosia sp. MC521]|uniref:Na(+)-translocating NADH-quinone reductase subunit A n=1 Tax=Devosia sp. MC521 TaxID=2759954 RepID=UPI0020C14706|nr:Na(+)-translocating NADH-quinone reductase subunit A [Devosia sp. MC521]
MRGDRDIFGLGRGLSIPLSTPNPLPKEPETLITDEAGLSVNALADLRAEPLVSQGDIVKQGAPVLRDRRHPEYVITAPMAGRVTALEIGAGRRLSSMVFAAETRQQQHRYDARAAGEEIAGKTGRAALRALLQETGLWRRFNVRPFGRIPKGDAKPAAIFVMAVDTRPLAASPRIALDEGSAVALQRGIAALGTLCAGPVFFCQDRGPDIVQEMDRLHIIRVGDLHPAGLAGHRVLDRFPARLDRQVWDIGVDDVVAIGELLEEGTLPTTRLVAVVGPGLRASRLVRCQPGADLSEICYRSLKPGPTVIFSGSVLDGAQARWLGEKDRQVTVLPRSDTKPQRHWLDAALRRASRPEPIIATAAVEEALGGFMPGMALLRALSVGDDEAAAELGALSLVEADLAMVDYVTAASPRFSDLLRAALDRMEANT